MCWSGPLTFNTISVSTYKAKTVPQNQKSVICFHFLKELFLLLWEGEGTMEIHTVPLCVLIGNLELACAQMQVVVNVSQLICLHSKFGHRTCFSPH